MKATIKSLERRIDRVKEKLLAIGDLRPGYLSEQYNVCGNPRCRCKADPPQRHGPYFQLGWKRKGKDTTRFIRKDHVDEVRAQIQNYKKMQKLLEEWIDLSIEKCELKLAEARACAAAKNVR